MRERSSRSSIRWPARSASLATRAASRRKHLEIRGVVFDGQRVGQRDDRADRRAQLVRDVGDEIAADGVEPVAIRDVLHDRDRGLRCLAQRHRRHGPRARRRSVEFDDSARPARRWPLRETSVKALAARTSLCRESRIPLPLRCAAFRSRRRRRPPRRWADASKAARSCSTPRAEPTPPRLGRCLAPATPGQAQRCSACSSERRVIRSVR